MNLYLLSQDENRGYGTFDSCVVAAESEEEAREIHPNSVSGFRFSSTTWASTPDNVQVKLIGAAIPGTKAGEVICSSFNAG